MASLLFKEMKGVNFSCASPASAAVCTSIDRRSMVRPCTGRALDRHSPHIQDSRRAKPITNPMSQAPSNPKSYTHKSRKRSDKQVGLISPADSSRYLLNDDPYFDVVLPDLEEPLPPLLPPEPAARPQTSKGDDPTLQPFSRRDDSSTVLRPSSFKAFDSAFVRPSSSLRGDDSNVSRSPAFGGDDDSAVLRPSSARPKDQVVVLRVSLHCKGCEAKVRKHISKMAGVTSFNIEFATKKVTVIGDVTPLGVLNSISKVKNAQFWPSPPTSSSPP